MTPDDLDVVARTVWGEARGEPKDGRVAVAWVIKNRVKSPRWWGTDYPSVCKRPFQFSCWNLNDPNRAKIEALTEDDKAFRECLKVASGVISGEVPDNTGGATHYFADSIEPPVWTKRMTQTVTIGHHTFFKDT